MAADALHSLVRCDALRTDYDADETKAGQTEHPHDPGPEQPMEGSTERRASEIFWPTLWKSSFGRASAETQPSSDESRVATQLGQSTKFGPSTEHEAGFIRDA